LPTLHQCLVDPNPQVRRDALAAIGRFQDARSVEPVLRCLHDPATRSEAERALRQFGPIAEPAVLPLLSQKDAQVRGSALRVLGDVGTQQCVPAVRAAMQTDMDAIVRAIAEDTLRAITARGKK
jgi:HEAT repeat protein